MILTTPTKQPFTTTKHNNKSYIFTLYLFMLLCVVGNCLLSYCSCTGNCENCCGINASIKDKIESEFGNKDNNKKKKVEEKKEEKQEEKKIENEHKDNNMDDSENKLEEVKIFDYGKIDNIQIVNSEFVKANLVKAYVYKCSSDNYERKKEEFLNGIKPTGKTYLSAYVEVKKFDDNVVGYFIHCTNANSKINNDYVYGLFHGSAATKIVILSCGNNITNMSGMFSNCDNLLSLDLSSLDTENVTDMRYMFYICSSLTNITFPDNLNTNTVKDMSGMFFWCSSLTKLDLSNFNTVNVTDMNHMFSFCSSLTNLNLSKFNTDKVTDMSGMFYYCFKNEATLICQASTIKNIIDDGGLRLTIQNENNDDINHIINMGDNQRVYKCSVERVIEEYYAEVEGPKIIVM